MWESRDSLIRAVGLPGLDKMFKINRPVYIVRNSEKSRTELNSCVF